MRRCFLPGAGRRPVAGALALSIAVVVCVALAPAAPAAAQAPAGPNLDALTGSFLGVGSGVDQQTAIDIGRDRGVTVAGQVSGGPLGGRTVNLGGSTGTVVRLDNEGRQVRSVTRIGTIVEDMEIARGTGHIAVTGDFGVALLDETASGAVWQDRTCAGERGPRVATDQGGVVVALCSGTVTLIGQDGKQIGSFRPQHHTVQDVALIDRDGLGLVLLTGHDLTTGRDGQQLQSAYVDAYDFRGNHQWRAYGWPGDEAPGFAANTRGIRVVRGHDRWVYLLAEADGQDNPFRALPQDPQQPARLVGLDAYDSPDGGGAPAGATAASAAAQQAEGPMLFVARLNAQNGRQVAGRFALARAPDGRPAPTYGLALAADTFGNVVVGGAAQCCIPQRQALHVGGQPVPQSQGLDAFVLSLDSGLDDRRAWTAWGRGGQVEAVASVAGVAAMAGSMTTGDVVTLEPLPGHAAAAGNVSAQAPDGYFATWRSPEFTEHPPGLTAEQIAAEEALATQGAAQGTAQAAAPEESTEAVSPLASDAASASASGVAASEASATGDPDLGAGNRGDGPGTDGTYLTLTLVLVLLAATPAAVSSARRRLGGRE